MILRVLALLVFLGVNVFIVSAQDNFTCNCWLAKIDRTVSPPNDCRNREELTDEEVLTVIECLLKQKGNKSAHWGVTLRNDVSQTFGPSPVEVVALFYASYLFQENKEFASAMVLHYDGSDEKFNTPRAVRIAHKAYRKWFEKIKKIGLEEARKQKLDPLEGTGVSWY